MTQEKLKHANVISKRIDEMRKESQYLGEVMQRLKESHTNYGSEFAIERLVKLLCKKKEGVQALDQIVVEVCREYESAIQRLKRDFEAL